MTKHETDRPAAVPPPMSRAAKAEALLLRFTAEAHRRKWNYDRGLDGDGVPVKSEAFDALHRLGEEMRVALEELRRMPAAVSVPPPAPRADDLRWAADRLVEEIQRGARFSHEDARQPGLAESVMLLRRWADEAQQPEPPSAALARQSQETLIRRITEGPCVAGEQQAPLCRCGHGKADHDAKYSDPQCRLCPEDGERSWRHAYTPAGEQQNETPEAVSRPTRYEVNLVPETDDPGGIYAITVEYRGDNRWAVLRHSLCLSLDGQWDRERNSSEREEEWLDAHRFDLDTALRLAEEQAVDIAPAKWSGRDRKPQHVGGRVNAEDCPACHGTNPPYPFICPGPSAP